MTYKIYGDYGYTGERLLAEYDTFDGAVRWLYEYDSDTCGALGRYSVVEIATFSESGEYLVHKALRAHDGMMDDGMDDDSMDDDLLDDDPMDDFNYPGHPMHY